MRYMKKLDKDQNFAAQVKSLCDIAERCMLQNKQIDMFEEYFFEEESEHIVENMSTKTLMLLKDPPDVCKRAVSEVSWHTEGPSKLAVSYAITRFQQTPEKMKNNSYVWDLQNPNAPEITLSSPSPVTNLSYNHKLTDIIGGGCYNGIVGKSFTRFSDLGLKEREGSSGNDPSREVPQRSGDALPVADDQDGPGVCVHIDGWVLSLLGYEET